MRSVFMVACLILVSGNVVRAETLAGVLKAHGVALPAGSIPDLERTVDNHRVLDDARDLLVVYTLGRGDAAQVHAVRFDKRSRAWRSAALEWRGIALGPHTCEGDVTIERFALGFLVRVSQDRTRECTIIIDRDLRVRGVLAGSPVAKLNGGRIVYQRNRVNAVGVHPVTLAMFDPLSPDGEIMLFPRAPYQPARIAQMARTRASFSATQCKAGTHPCDPDWFDEHLAGDVATDMLGDSLVFVVQWDNTAGWSETERWGRLEAFRETRAALAKWDGQSTLPATIEDGLHAGLDRVKAMGRTAEVLAALEEPIRELVAAALASAPGPGQTPRAWLIALDPRWAAPETWRRLGRAIAVPDEFVDVIYVYTGLRTPDRLRYREILRRDFEAQFGTIPPSRALEPDVRRRIIGVAPNRGRR